MSARFRLQPGTYSVIPSTFDPDQGARQFNRPFGKVTPRIGTFYGQRGRLFRGVLGPPFDQSIEFSPRRETSCCGSSPRRAPTAATTTLTRRTAESEGDFLPHLFLRTFLGLLKLHGYPLTELIFKLGQLKITYFYECAFSQISKCLRLLFCLNVNASYGTLPSII